MQTLNREITATFYRHPQEYERLRSHWSRLMQDPEARQCLSAAHHLLYLVLRGKNWQKAFTPPGGGDGPRTEAQRIRLQKRLANGAFYDWGARKALRALHAPHAAEILLAPFAEFLPPEVLCAIRERVPPLGWDENPLEREPYHA